jgi:uncharacterized coiled-coil protein SlyX
MTESWLDSLIKQNKANIARLQQTWNLLFLKMKALEKKYENLKLLKPEMDALFPPLGDLLLTYNPVVEPSANPCKQLCAGVSWRFCNLRDRIKELEIRCTYLE